MKEKLRNLFDEMKVRSRYKSMNAIIDMIEPLINQEVEKRIVETVAMYGWICPRCGAKVL